MDDIGMTCEPARARRSGGRQARVAMRAAPLADDVRPVRGGLPGGEGTYYRALVRADRTSLNTGPTARRLDVLPGMTGMADIRTGERSVLSFVLRPMLKSQEAFRER